MAMAESKNVHENLDSVEATIHKRTHPEKLAFFFPATKEYLKREVLGKRVLDIGCGTGYWSSQAAQFGAKSVDGFDISEEIVQLAKKVTSSFPTVTIQCGDVTQMPYDDNSFDVAMSLYVTCSLPMDACISHYKELSRVLSSNGKGLVINFSKPVFDTMLLSPGTDLTAVETKIQNAIASLPDHPKYPEIKSVFENFDEITRATFAVNDNGYLFRVSNVDQLKNGQEVWIKTSLSVYSDYYYNTQFFKEQIQAAGLCLDQLENFYTEERRIAYDKANPMASLHNTNIDNPPFLMYHVKKILVYEDIHLDNRYACS